MNRNVTIVVIIIILIVIGIIVGISYSNNQPATEDNGGTPVQVINSPSAASSTSAAASTTAQNYTVTYTDSGFSPASIRINNGDSVTWVNQSAGRMWVASNPHPTHTDLPGFDEKAAIGNGSSWTYTFIVSGSHGYHNHANPSMGGTVIVE